MAIYEDVLLRLDERSARAVSDQMADAAHGGLQAFDRAFASGALRGTMQRAGREATQALATELRSGVQEALGGAMSQFGSMGRAADSALGAIGPKAVAAGAGIAAIAVGAGVAGKALYDLGKQWDDISDSMTLATGKTGDQLKQLTDIVGDVGSRTAASLSAIGNVTQQISQSLPDLAQNNAAVRQMASNLAYLDANGRSVDIRQLGMAFNAFGVNANNQVKALDDLAGVSRNANIPINELIGTVRAGAPQFKQFGLDLGQSTGLLASFAQAGVAPEIAVTGLRIALKNVGGEGQQAAVNLSSAVTQIKALHDAQQEGAAQSLAQDTFGTKNAAAFLQVIESGAVDVRNLNKAMQDTGPSLASLQDSTDDWSESLEKSKNTVATALKPVADTVFGGISTLLSNALESTRMWGEALGITSNQLKDLAAVPISPDSALGKMLTPGGLPGSSTPGAATPGGLGNSIGVNVPGAGLRGANGLLAPQWGSHNVSGPSLSTSSSGGAGAAQVPYGALPGLQPGVPMTPEVYSAQSSLWEANHSVEEKRARVLQLQGDNNAKAEEKVAAQNEVDQAVRSQHEAEMRFIETQKKAYEAQYKQLDKAATDLGQIGAQLDSDFGISKGLGGIVENITKMLANFAAAPVIGALAGGQIGLGFKPGEAGSGLSSILANSGVFGSQFVAQSSYGGSGAAMPIPGGGGGAAATPLPGESPRDFAHRVMMPFWQNQGFQVGDHGADQFGEHQNGALDIMVPSLQAGQQVLQQVLSDPNVYGAIFNNQTYGYGHGATPQDYTSGHTGDPSQDHTNHVHALYKPGGAGNINPGGTPMAAAGGLSTGGATPVFVVNMPGGGLSGGDQGGLPSWFGGGKAPGVPGGSLWDKVAQAESTGNWSNADTGNNGHYGGLQFSPSTWNLFGGNEFADMPNQASRDEQIEVANRTAFTGYKGTKPQGLGAWEAITKGMVPGVTTSTPQTAFGSPGQGYPLPWKLGGGPQDAGPFGPQDAGPFGPDVGTPQPGQVGPFPVPGGVAAAGNAAMAGSAISAGAFPAPGGGPGTDPTLIGGLAPKQGSGKGGIGIQGGILGAAMGAASSGSGMAVDMMAPGAGAAASAVMQIGIQEANRAIQFGGQVAGIAADGLMQTFLPMGASELAQNNWLTKIIGGVAGAGVMLPNTAGGGKKTPEGLTPEQAAQFQQGQGQKPQDAVGANAKDQGGGGQMPNMVNSNNTTTHNTTVQTNADSISGAAKDWDYHLGAAATPVGG